MMASQAGNVDPDEVANVLRARRGAVLERWLPEASSVPKLYDALVMLLQRKAPSEMDRAAPCEDPALNAAAQAHAHDLFERGLTSASVLTDFRVLRQEIGRALHGEAERIGDVRAAELLVEDVLDCTCITVLEALEARDESRRRAAAELAAIVASSSDAIIGMRLDGIITGWNPGAVELYGYSEEQAVGANIGLIIPTDRSNELSDILERVGRGERVAPFETSRLRHDGSRLDVFVTVSPVWGPDRTVVGASAIAQDITERKIVEQALIESEANFHMLADNVSQLAWMAEPNGWIFWYNRRWFEYTGTTFEQMQGWGWTTVHHPEYVEGVVERIQHAWDSGQPWEDVFPLRARDGTYSWFLSRAQPIRDASGKIVRWFGTNTDITQLREAEEALRRSEQQREALLAAITHDLRNPMTSIKGLAQVLRHQANSGGLTNEYLISRLDMIGVSVDRMTAQLDEVRFVWAPEDARARMRREPTDLVALVRDTAAAHQLGSELHNVEFASPLHQLVALVDARRLGRVLDNLVANALKYSPHGGNVTLSVQRHDNCADISVHDEGLGIPASDLAHVFDRFRRGSNVGSIQGSGIGLATAREIVEAHGGSIDVVSHPADGTTFHVRLPLWAS
jgi:PAS domain S-box-containing protein